MQYQTYECACFFKIPRLEKKCLLSDRHLVFEPPTSFDILLMLMLHEYSMYLFQEYSIVIMPLFGKYSGHLLVGQLEHFRREKL